MADKKLNEVAEVTDMAYVPVIMSDGSIGRIAKADLATVVAGVITTVGANKRGLMPLGSYGFQNGGSSRLFTTLPTTNAFTISVLLSLNASNGNPTNLLYITLVKPGGSSPSGIIKCIHGTVPLRILWKGNSDNTYSVYVERTQYTPGYGAILMSGHSFIKEGLLTSLSDNSEIDDTCVEFTTVQ